MIAAAWIAAIVGVLGILGLLLRISFQIGALVQRFGDHVSAADKVHSDQETRIRALEHSRPRPSGGHI